MEAVDPSSESLQVGFEHTRFEGGPIKFGTRNDFSFRTFEKKHRAGKRGVDRVHMV